MQTEMNSVGTDIYIRTIDKTGARSITSFRIWNREKFLFAITAQYAKENGRVEVVTYDDYVAFRKGGAA